MLIHCLAVAPQGHRHSGASRDEQNPETKERIHVMKSKQCVMFYLFGWF